MRSRCHVAKTPQKKKYDILKGQQHHRQHNRGTKTGKELLHPTSFGRPLGLISWNRQNIFVPQKNMETYTSYPLGSIRLIISAVIYLYMDSKKGNKKEWLSSKTLSWGVRVNPNIQHKDCFRKNNMTSWVRMLVFMNAHVRSVIYTHNASKTRTYGPIPHMVIAITPSCQLYQFNPP